MERLQKILSAAGICSRRQAEEFLRAGRVTVNGVPASLGDSADPAGDVVCLDGRPLSAPAERLYLMLHKPRGYVTTLSDERGRRTAADLTADCGARVYPVGRLDMDSEGLLLMTNDGDFAQRLAHPSHGLENGTPIAPARVVVLARRGGRWVLSVVICQGLNRQVRRMCALAGLEVARLVRVREGPLELGSLPGGRWRRLTEEELTAVYRSSGRKTPE